MLTYSTNPDQIIPVEGNGIASFLSQDIKNVDWTTVQSFGEEWTKFSEFDQDELRRIGQQYFDIVPADALDENTLALDVGCGTGRWSSFLAPKVKFIEAIDPSKAVLVAHKALSKYGNVRVTQASVDTAPFPNSSFDFVFSLGVLHHIPDTSAAMKAAVAKLKPGGWFLVYLYYDFENRGLLFRALFQCVNIVRRIICRLPSKLKFFICDLIGLFVYWPVSRVSKIFGFFGVSETTIRKIPLSFYANKSLTVMLNDSLDRFGTPLEQRFSRAKIKEMMSDCGLGDIRFSDKEPFWHAVGRKRPQAKG